jgi:methyl-accepting chemotaxis protein
MGIGTTKVGTRLTLAFAVMILITAAMAALGVWSLQKLKLDNKQIATVHNQRNTLALRWSAAINLNWLRLQALLKTSDVAYITSLQKDIAETVNGINTVQKELDALISDEQGQALVDQVGKSRQRYRDIRDALLKRKLAGEDVGAEVDRDLQPLVLEYLKNVELVQAYVQERLAYAEKGAEHTADSSQIFLSIVSGVSIALGLFLATWVTRSVTHPLGGEPHEAARVAQSVAAGDLSVEITLRPGDTASLMAQLKAMQAGLVTVVSHVREHSEGVAVASAQIAEGNQDLSSRTENQASALEQTAASMEQLGATVKQNADSATQANHLARSATTVAIQGGEVVARVVDTMKGINDSSKRIFDIISVIDGIAFQTNILALNAAVEAARAGEHGRGFAVVATEVRGLAGRASDAAKEIKTLIGTSVERVEQGTALVHQAGETMNEVVNAIQRVTDLMTEISAASNEQSQGVVQVGEAVTQMDQVTQQNASLVEEIANAAGALRSKSRDLVDLVAIFNLGRHRGYASQRIAR